MEAVPMNGSWDQSISSYQSPIGNPRKPHHYPFYSISNPTENNNYFPIPSHFQTTVGFLQPPAPAPPPFLSHSYPPYSSQPPLLPLPASAPLRRAPSRSFSGPPSSNKKPNNNSRIIKDSNSLNSKKTSKPLPKKFSEQSSISKSLSTVSSANNFHKEQPKNVPKVLPLISSSGSRSTNTNPNNCNNSSRFSPDKESGGNRSPHNVAMFSGSAAFTISSPPPSSLPLPSFSLRPKLSCNAEAADTGSATDDLRRLLQLR
ncbi:pollen-specific leucine-rich repeat extensin-like protein 2 [Andrographis paniculata]|uniref:pollen-specific leucine-rich repeat extensin-like protein 2 n=1 Tax=Andrographis paniculata TaxID=175694 RepID=UPI0021E99862|nr:pollen-specific leucine-rich repeat extensin-like protein 2 [Andrographis paniculata]